ncbi:hypothetical protein C8J56DRAFT_1057972 [Mycena floridula]|nr:hypothetical protein C8J56DRAFT_1057972 [Mycena floridula]
MFCCMYEVLWITSDNPTMTPTFLRSNLVTAFHHEFCFPTPVQLPMGPQFDVMRTDLAENSRYLPHSVSLGPC